MSRAARHAFTLIELLAVIAIMGIIAAIALPSIQGLKPNPAAAASRQLLDAVTHARQLALSQRTTVYMVFVPPWGFWNDPNYAYSTWTTNDQTLANSLIEKQMTAYCYVCLRSVGDQPGVSYPRYLTPWRSLPQGAFITYDKFQQFPNANSVLTIYTNTPASPPPAAQVFAFTNTTSIPFPSETTKKPASGKYIKLPYIAFNGMGQLVREDGSPTQPEFIPITQGSAGISHDPNTKAALKVLAAPREVPPGNTSNNFNLVFVDQLTGRARIEHTKVQ
jgi:prepilin-type N-terminal cleavage/methylation domain-containing protein